MNKIDSFEDIIYIENKKMSEYVVVAAIIFLAINLLFIKFPIVANGMIGIYFIIASLSIVLLIKSTLIISNKDYFAFKSFTYLAISTVNIVSLLLNNGEIVYKSTTVIGEKFFILEILMCILISMTYIICLKYVTRKRDKYVSVSIIILILASIYTLQVQYYLVAYKIMIVLNIMINIASLRCVLKYKLFKKDKVNYISLGLILIIIMYVIDGILRITGVDFFILNYIKKILVFISFSFVWCSMVDKLINRPYKILFSDLYEKNNEMDIINKKIVAKNRELEFSQLVLNKKEKMLKTLFTNVPVPLVILNSDNNRIVYCNSYFLELIGEKKNTNVINKKLFSIIKLNKESYNREYIKSNIFAGEVTVEGKVIYIDLEFIESTNKQGEVIVLFNNVTTKVAVDRIKESMQNKMMEERIKREFLSNISHDLKTPINVIYSATQLNDIFIQEANDQALCKYNVISKHNCLLLIKLTNNLIDSSKIFSEFLSANLETKNIVEVVENTIMGLVDYTKGKNLDLIFDTNHEEIYLMLDEEFMQRILLNIISNAIKFTSEGGLIQVCIEVNENDEVIVRITDNGAGMEQEFIKKCFNRYSMGKNNEINKEKGTGVGLFVVKNLVERQGGHINIESEVGVGTCIELRFKMGYKHG